MTPAPEPQSAPPGPTGGPPPVGLQPALVEAEFDPIPFDADAARIFGRLSASALAAGRSPRRRIADLMIAATASAQGLALYTANIADFRDLEAVVDVVEVTRPPRGP